jgi:hypothetical protein
MSRTISTTVACPLARLALADEPGVLGEAAGIEIERHAVAVAGRAHLAQVGQRHRLAAARVVGDGDEHAGHVAGALGEQRLEARDVHVALEGMLQRRVEALRDDQVDRLRAGGLDVGAGGVEVGVVRHDLARPAERGHEDLLGGASLVGRDDVLEGEQRLHRRLEAIPGRRARIGLVAALDAGPLLARHRPGTGIGQQVDQHVLAVQAEQVEADRPARRAARPPWSCAGARPSGCGRAR